MRITEETETRLVVKQTARYTGLILLAAGVVFAFFAHSFMLATMGKTAPTKTCP